ncbi:MAG: methyltransferase family protein [Chloroflexota bacterium]
MSRLPSLGPRGVGWVLIQGILLVIVVAAGTVGPAWTDGLRILTSALGGAAIVAGIVLAARGARDLGSALTPLPQPRPHTDLVVTGVYRLARHPIYGGLIVAALGWGLLTASPAALFWSLVLWGFFELKSRREEVWLEARFPGYPDYRARTPRLIPWIGGTRG